MEGYFIFDGGGNIEFTEDENEAIVAIAERIEEGQEPAIDASYINSCEFIVVKGEWMKVVQKVEVSLESQDD